MPKLQWCGHFNKKCGCGKAWLIWIAVEIQYFDEWDALPDWLQDIIIKICKAGASEDNILYCPICRNVYTKMYWDLNDTFSLTKF